MLIPILPLYLRETGLSYSSVSTVIAAVGIGSLVAQLPMGALVARFTQRTVMVVAHLVIGVTAALLGVVTATIALVALRFVSGVGNSAWLLSRHSFLTSNVETDVRGRASAIFGAVTRVGVLVGPVLGGAIASEWGFTVAFAVTGALSAIGVVPMLAAPVEEPAPAETRRPLSVVIRERWRALLAVGVVQFGYVAVRTGRYAVVPFLGAATGLGVREVGILVTIGSAAELITAPVAGWLMDRYGRMAAIIPSLVVFGGGLVLAGLARTHESLFIAVVVIGLGNGLGSGTMLTIGSDLAPKDHPAGFLAVTGVIREAGRTLGPLIVGWLADWIGLGASAYALAVVAALTALFTWRFLGDTRAG